MADVAQIDAPRPLPPLFSPAGVEYGALPRLAVKFKETLDGQVKLPEQVVQIVLVLVQNLSCAVLQRCGAVCHEIPLNPILRKQGSLTIFSNRNRSKIVTSSRNPHVWLRFENWRREWDSNPSQPNRFRNL
jgi:hypothetical protein